MIKRVILTILIGLSIPTLGYSQTDSIPESQTRFSTFLNHEKLAFKLSYFGELLLHPGLEIGSDFTLVDKKWVDVHWDINLSGYYHKWNNSSYSLSSSIGTRFPIYALFFDLNIVLSSE